MSLYGQQALQRSERSTISVEEAANYLGIGRAAAYLAVKNGELPSLRLGSRILCPSGLCSSPWPAGVSPRLPDGQVATNHR